MARYNTAPQTLEVTGTTTFTYAFTGGIISLTGTPGYTVTLVSPVFFPGSRQTFYNATSDFITLETAAGTITGNGVTLGSTIDIPTNSTYQLTSDGTNYVLTSALAGTTVFELPVTFNDVLNADGKVELNPVDNNVEIKPTGTGTVDISPQSSVSIQPGAQVTIRPTGNLSLSSASGTVSLGDIGKTTSFPGNIEFTANNQTINISPTGTSSAVTIDPAGNTSIDAGGTTTITSTTLGSITNMSIGSSNPSTGAFTSLTAGGGVTFTANAASTSTTSGTLIVTGGIGASGAIYAGSLQSTPIGNTTASTGAFTTLTSNGATTFTANTASTNTTTGTLVVTGGVGIGGALHAGSMQNTPIGTSTRSSGAFTTLAANSTVDFTATTEASSSTVGAVQIDGGVAVAKRVYSGGGFQGAVGNVSASTGAFTSLTASSTVTLSPGNANVTLSPTGTGTVTLSPAGGGSINNISIGATTASTGRFTTITATSNASVSGTLTVDGNVTLGNATSDSVDINGSLTVDNGFNHNSTGATRIARGTTAQRPTGVDGYIRYNSDIEGPEFSDSTTWRAMKSGFYYNDVTSNITAATWNCYFVDTNGGARTITLPNSGLIKGDTIRFLDLRKTFDTNALTIARNGQPIQGDAADLTVNTEGAAFDLIWHSSTYGWRIFSI